jgi:hypothetical protein
MIQEEKTIEKENLRRDRNIRTRETYARSKLRA